MKGKTEVPVQQPLWLVWDRHKAHAGPGTRARCTTGQSLTLSLDVAAWWLPPEQDGRLLSQHAVLHALAVVLHACPALLRVLRMLSWQVGPEDECVQGGCDCSLGAQSEEGLLVVELEIVCHHEVMHVYPA